MSPLLRKLLLIDLFKFHKSKILATLFFFLVMFMWVFPFSDLSDFVTDQVSTQTQGRVFVQFGDLDFGIFPSLSIEGQEVLVEAAGLPTLRIAEIKLWPSLMSLISAANQPGDIPNFSLRASGLFNGALAASVSNGKSPDKEITIKDIRVDGDSLDLSELGAVAGLPLKLQGLASIEGALNVDPRLRIQPEGEVNLIGQRVRIPPGNIPTQMGPLFLPGFSWSNMNVKSRLSNGVLYIDQAVLGRPQDALYLQVKGQLNAPIQPQGVMVRTYDLRMDLQINPTLAKELGPFLSFIERFKRSSGANSRYVFRAVSNSPGAPPNLLPLSTF